MRQSQLFGQTSKQAPRLETSVNAELLQRAGFIAKLMAGVYTYLPLGLKVLDKIKDIIRREMNQLGAQELLMPALQPKELWKKTGRWQELADIMFQFRGRGNKQIGLATTHEEVITDLVQHRIKSYKDLPLALYQIQDKFRNEPRARSGLLRGREFSMKDLYSFHADGIDFAKFYEKVKKTYLKIFQQCGLKVKIVKASGGAFSKEFSDEFQVLVETGEDQIIYCSKCNFARNKEICSLKPGQDRCPECQAELCSSRAIEVGNTFSLGDKYSQALNAFFIDKNGDKKYMIMGCYGLGPSRIMGTVVEVHHDDKGIIWPKQIAPFDVHLIVLGKEKEVLKTAQNIYQKFNQGNILFDDRIDKSAGEKLADADLIGIPLRMVVSLRTLQKKSVELKYRQQKQIQMRKINELEKIFDN